MAMRIAQRVKTKQYRQWTVINFVNILNGNKHCLELKTIHFVHTFHPSIPLHICTSI